MHRQIKAKENNHVRRRSQAIYGITSLKRPDIPTEHLMSNFDSFYEGVVSRQLAKDKIQVKQKYANCTHLGEAEQKMSIVAHSDTNLDGSMIDNGASFHAQTTQGHSPSPSDMLMDFQRKSARPQVIESGQEDIVLSSPSGVGLVNPNQEHMLQFDQDARLLLQPGMQNTTSGNGPILLDTQSKLSAHPTTKQRANSMGGTMQRYPQQKFHQRNLTGRLGKGRFATNDPDKPGSGITQYTIAQKPALLKSVKRAQSSRRDAASNLHATMKRRMAKQGQFQTSQVQSATLSGQNSIAQLISGQDLRNQGSLAKANNKKLIARMLTDDEKYRKRILQGYLSHLSHTNRNSPGRKQIGETLNDYDDLGNLQNNNYVEQLENTASQGLQSLNAKVMEMGSGSFEPRPDTSQSSQMLNKVRPDFNAKVEQAQIVYSRGSTAKGRGGTASGQARSSEKHELATMHTSEGDILQNQNFGSKRLINQMQMQESNRERFAGNNSGQDLSQINIGMMKPSIEASQTMTAMNQIDYNVATGVQPSTASRLDSNQVDTGGLYYHSNNNTYRVTKPSQNRIIGDPEHDNVFKSLEIESKQTVRNERRFGKEPHEANLADDVNRMRQRPMTGAVIHRAKSKNRRFGPYNGGTIRGYPNQNQAQANTNRFSYYENLTTLQSMTKRDPSGMLTAGNNNSKQMLLGFTAQQRNFSTANFSSQPLRTQDRAKVGKSLQSMALKENLTTQNWRAFSSKQNPKLGRRIATGQPRVSHSRSSSIGRQNFVGEMLSATALSQIPPKTNVQVLDDYYSQYDTNGQICSIKFSAEFERLKDKIEKFWKLKQTPKAECDQVRKLFAQMKIMGEGHEVSEFTQRSTLSNMNGYLKMMKDYYQTEVKIRNIYQEREKTALELISVSNSFDQELFQTKGMALILKLRMLTVQLVYAVKRWKSMVMRATATFTIENALRGKDIGRQITVHEHNETRQKIKSLRPSSDALAQSSVSTQASSFRTSQDKFRHNFKREQKKQLQEQEQAQVCVLCYISKDQSIQRDGGLLIRKLANFTTDSIVFTMKGGMSEAKSDILKLSMAFPKEQAFKFSEKEMSYFERLYRILDPKSKAKQHMQQAFDFLNSHICQQTCTVKTQPKEFEFNFEWGQDAQRLQTTMQDQANNLSDIQWNFSNLDRTDRIQMMYTTLQDGLVKQYVEQDVQKKLQSKNGKVDRGQLAYELGVTSKEQVIVEDEEAKKEKHSLKLSHQSPPQSEGCANMTTSDKKLLYNLDINEQLLEDNQQKEARNAEIASAADPRLNHSSLQYYKGGIETLNSGYGERESVPENQSLPKDDSNTVTQKKEKIVTSSYFSKDDKKDENQKTESRRLSSVDPPTHVEDKSNETEQSRGQKALITENEGATSGTQGSKIETERQEITGLEKVASRNKEIVPVDFVLQAEISGGIDLFNSNAATNLDRDSSIKKQRKSSNFASAEGEDDGESSAKAMRQGNIVESALEAPESNADDSKVAKRLELQDRRSMVAHSQDDLQKAENDAVKTSVTDNAVKQSTTKGLMQTQGEIQRSQEFIKTRGSDLVVTKEAENGDQDDKTAINMRPRATEELAVKSATRTSRVEPTDGGIEYAEFNLASNVESKSQIGAMPVPGAQGSTMTVQKDLIDIEKLDMPSSHGAGVASQVVSATSGSGPGQNSALAQHAVQSNVDQRTESRNLGSNMYSQRSQPILAESANTAINASDHINIQSQRSDQHLQSEKTILNKAKGSNDSSNKHFHQKQASQSTIQTDKSPGDYVNYVSIRVNQSAGNDTRELAESEVNMSGTEKSAGVAQAIRYDKEPELILIDSKAFEVEDGSVESGSKAVVEEQKITESPESDLRQTYQRFQV